MNESRFIGAHVLAEVFAGLTFDSAKMRVALPDGRLVNKARFDVLFAGNAFALDAQNERTTRSAWRAFTANAAFRPHIVFK